MQPQPYPGAEFFQRRLQRAQAVPAEERSPEVAAFVESAELLRGIAQLLPMTADGQRALPDTTATRERIVRALLNLIRSDYICPCSPECDIDVQAHWEAYLPLLRQDVEAADELTQLVLVYPERELAHALSCSLEDPSIEQAVSRQLEQLAADTGQPAPLTAQQLRYACCIMAASHCQRLINSDLMVACGTAGPQLSAAQLAASRQELAHAAQVMQELEPDNPRSLVSAVSAALWTEQGDPTAAARLSLSAHQLARQQGSDWWAALAGSMALEQAVHHTISRSGLQAALAAYQQAEAALQRCKRLLPNTWVHVLQASVSTVSPMVQAAQALLQGQLVNRRAVAAGAVADARPAVVSAASGQPFECHGCGKRAAGLRRCARCKQAQYCSRECQSAHWQEHKPDCKPAQ